MQINRLFEIIYILLDEKTVTSKVLAERFGVSTRTIFRDVETLSGAGIPIYMSKGKGGGIRLLDHFVLNKSVLTENEQNEILSALHGFKLLEPQNSDSILNKLGNFFNRKAVNWIDIDFSHWYSDETEKDKFYTLKDAILSRNVITFSYHAPHREAAFRTVEPLQIYFKEKSWYLKAFCTDRQDYRTFKITRMRGIQKTEQTFFRELKPEPKQAFSEEGRVKLTLRFKKEAWGRVYDEMDGDSLVTQDENSLIVEFACPLDEWVYSFILSYGAGVEVLAPQCVKDTIKQKLEDSLSQYRD